MRTTGEGVLKSPNFRVRTSWMVPFSCQEKLPGKPQLAFCNEFRLYLFCHSLSESSFLFEAKYLFYIQKQVTWGAQY